MINMVWRISSEIVLSAYFPFFLFFGFNTAWPDKYCIFVKKIYRSISHYVLHSIGIESAFLNDALYITIEILYKLVLLIIMFQLNFCRT